MRMSLFLVTFLVACESDAPPQTPTSADGTSGLQEDLATCEGERETAETSLETCQTGLSSCESDRETAETSLATCQATLSTCESDLTDAETALEESATAEAEAEALRAACEADLTLAEQERDTCAGELATADQDLTTCEADALATEQALMTCESDRDQLQDELDAVILYDQDLVDFLGSEPGRAWTGYNVEIWGEHTDAYSMWFLADGSVIWWYRYGGKTGSPPPTWSVDTWSVTGATVTVHTTFGQMQFTHVAGSLIGPGNWRLVRQAALTLGVYQAADAVATGSWGPCTASDTWATDSCLVDDGSGGTNPMSLTWSHTPPGYARDTTPFVRRAWSPTAATNAMWQSPAGDVAVDHSAAGSRWVQMPLQAYAASASVTLDNAGANGEVIGDVVVFVEMDDWF